MSSPTTNSENELIAIREKLNEQSQELTDLRREFAAMHRNGNGHQASAPSFLETAQSNSLTDRRGMLKKVAGLAAGVAAVGLLRPSSSNAAISKPVSRTIEAPDTTGGNMILGQENDAQAVTGLHNTTTALVSTQLNVRNYGNVDFTLPSGTNVAIVGYANATGDTGNTNDIIGVWGEAHAGGGSKGGMFVADDTGVVVQAGRATFCLFSTDDVFPPTSGTFHTFGEVVVSTDYTLWYASSTPTVLRRLAGPALTANDLPTAGAFSFLKAPKRLVDTRTGSGFFDAGNHYGTDVLRTYNVVTLAGATFLPAKVSAVVGRITVAGATGAGGLQESPNPPPGAGNDLGFGTAVISFPPASTIPSFGVPFISALDASGNLRIHSIMGAGQTVDVIVDITGYYI